MTSGVSQNLASGRVTRFRTAAGPSTDILPVEELTAVLHNKVKSARVLMRSPERGVLGRSVADTHTDGPAGRASHPVYGIYLGEWNAAPGARTADVLIDLFKNSLGDLRSAISRRRRGASSASGPRA